LLLDMHIFARLVSFIVLPLPHILSRGTLPPITHGTTTITEKIMAEVAPLEEETSDKPSFTENEKRLEQADWSENYAEALTRPSIFGGLTWYMVRQGMLTIRGY
jgi:hypothetical protein